MTPIFEPVTPARLADLRSVMMESSASKNCWCAYWYRSAAAYKAGWGKDNSQTLEMLVRDGVEPGLIGYVDGKPAGWVSVAPRRNFDRLNRSKNFAPVDEANVWAVNCFVVAKAYRKQGLMSALARAAADFALSRGAAGAEAYPIEPSEKTSAADLYLGTVEAFRAAGYVEVARPLPRRPVMRLMGA